MPPRILAVACGVPQSDDGLYPVGGLARASQNKTAEVVTPIMTRNFRALARALAPKLGGGHPRLLFALAFGLPLACASGSADQVMQPVALGMTSAMMPYYSDGNLTLYEVQVPVPLPVAKPTSAEVSSLGPAPAGTPYPRTPFLTADDESVEVQYVITNLDTVSQTVWLLVDPWNEFVRYRPGVTVVDDDTTVPNLGYDLGFVVPAGSRIQGTLTPDDVHEIAIKLASTENLLASPAATQSQSGTDNSLEVTTLANHIFDQQNRSNSGDPLYTPWIPSVVAGLTGFDLGLRTSTAADVAVEIIVNVQDLNGNRFVTQGTSAAQIGIPETVLSPPSARF